MVHNIFTHCDMYNIEASLPVLPLLSVTDGSAPFFNNSSMAAARPSYIQEVHRTYSH